MQPVAHPWQTLFAGSPPLALALPVALIAHMAWRRSRYFGNTAPLLIAALLLILALGLAARMSDVEAVATAVLAALIGLAGCRNPLVTRCALIAGGYMAAFTVLGRTNNDSWGILYAPLLPLGLVFAPAAFRDLAKRAGLKGLIPARREKARTGGASAN